MVRLRVLAALTMLSLSALVPTGAWAAAAPFTNTVKLYIWPSSSNVFTRTTVPTNGNWDATLYGVDWRLESTLNPWGFHLNAVTGSEANWSGVLAGITSGTDTIWSADVSFRRLVPTGPGNVTVHGFLGYGSLHWSNVIGGITETANSAGFRIGGDASIPLGTSNWSLNGSVAWYPSNSTSLSVAGLTPSGTASATDWSVSAQFTQNLWVFEGGYRSANFDSGTWTGTTCPCNFKWNGFFVAVGRVFP